MLKPGSIPLAQLVDIMSTEAWYTLFAAGLLAPVVGVLISAALRSLVSWKLTAVAVFYVPALPLAVLEFAPHSASPALSCTFIALMPVGIVLGLVVAATPGGVTPRRMTHQRGFEVLPKREDKSE